MQPLASLSERDIDALTRALEGYHEEYTRGKDWDEILDEAAEYVHEKGTNVFVESGYWFAEFNVQMKDKGRMAGEYTIKAWAKDLDNEFVKEMKYFHNTPDAFMMEESNLYIPIRWGWANWFCNHMSKGGYVDVVKFGQCKEHELGAWDIANVKLKSRGTIVLGHRVANS